MTNRPRTTDSDFNWSLLSERDRERACLILGGKRQPDLDIQPLGVPYLYRWWVTPREEFGNVYLHVQVASDPMDRPLHDHPWDNQSVILSGGYVEKYVEKMPWGALRERRMYEGQTCHRKAEEAHRLILPDCFAYTMTLFTTGPVRRQWGFWCADHRGYPTWVSRDDCIIDQDGKSTFKLPERLR